MGPVPILAYARRAALPACTILLAGLGQVEETEAGAAHDGGPLCKAQLASEPHSAMMM